MPLHYLIILFVGMPILEFALLLEVHGIVGFWPTIILIFGTGFAGAALVRRQGIHTLSKIRHEMNIGNLPAPQMMDGIMILLAGAFLVTPGLLTDAAGFALLIPPVRNKIRFWLRKKLEQNMRNGYIQVNVNRDN